MLTASIVLGLPTSEQVAYRLLLLSNRESLRWVRGWFWVRDRSLHLESVHAFQMEKGRSIEQFS